jgi:hypothetical protein
MRIGLDFDNTIVGYDAAFLAAARAAGMVEASFSGGKRDVRDRLRAGPDGERRWQLLQGRVYGAHMGTAALIDGVAEFVARAHARGDELVIVSHKTQFGHGDPERIDLRQTARSWMRRNGFFVAEGLGLDEGAVFFESTREEKIARIAKLSPAAFVDDLPEVLDAPEFPAGVRRILFDPAGAAPRGRYPCAGSWREIAQYLLGPEP